MLDNNELLDATAAVVTAYLSNNPLNIDDIPEFISSVHSAFCRISADSDPESKASETPALPVPAVPIEDSVQSDYIVCLEDGKKLTMLKRHLKAAYGMTPAQYRERWGLPHDYPMTAPNYAAKRSVLSKELGLGRRAA